MSEKMLVTQALDERDLLVKKIQDKIAKASFADVKKHNEEKVLERRVSEEDFRRKAESAYQQIMDLIERYGRIDAAIVASNAATMIHPLNVRKKIEEIHENREKLLTELDTQIKVSNATTFVEF